MLVYFSSAQLAQSQTVAPPALLPLLHVTRLCKNRRLFTVAGDKVVRRFSNSRVLTAIPIPRSVRLSVRLSLLLGYTQGEVTSHNLWSQYDRHFVGKVKGKVFPYSLPSVGPGADPGVQAVSPQVT